MSEPNQIQSDQTQSHYVNDATEATQNGERDSGEPMRDSKSSKEESKKEKEKEKKFYGLLPIE